MQEIIYEDGIKTKEFFDSLFDALDDGKEKAKKKPIKEIKVTAIIPSKKR